MSKKVAPDGGRVIICGPSIRDLMLGADPFDHVSCVAELNGHYVFAAFEAGQLPDVGNSMIAELTLGEADRICSNILGKPFVFLTADEKFAPRESVMLKYEDWKSVVTRQSSGSIQNNNTSASDHCCLPALLIRVDQTASITLVALRPEIVLEYKKVLVNVGSWLRDVWSLSGTWMSEGDLKTLGLESKKIAVEHNGRQCALEEHMKRQLLVCHFAGHWRKAKIFYSNQGKQFATALGRTAPITRTAMHREVVEATCVNPPHDTAKRMFKSLRKEARNLYPSSPPILKPEELNWLLSVLFPLDFSSHIEKDLPVSELTKSSFKREIISPEVERLAKVVV